MDIIILILVGAVSGWIASTILRAKSSPLINILLGVVGGMLGSYIFGFLNVSLASGILGDIIVSVIGAAVLVIAFKLMSRK